MNTEFKSLLKLCDSGLKPPGIFRLLHCLKRVKADRIGYSFQRRPVSCRLSLYANSLWSVPYNQNTFQ